MKVTEKDVAYVADLANLELTDQERQRMLKDLNSILDYIDRLNELDTSDIPPMAQISAKFGQSEVNPREWRCARLARGHPGSMPAACRSDEECAGDRW